MAVWSLFSHQSHEINTPIDLYESQPAHFEVIQHMEHTNIDFDYNVEAIQHVNCMSVALLYCVLKLFF